MILRFVIKKTLSLTTLYELIRDELVNRTKWSSDDVDKGARAALNIWFYVQLSPHFRSGKESDKLSDSLKDVTKFGLSNPFYKPAEQDLQLLFAKDEAVRALNNSLLRGGSNFNNCTTVTELLMQGLLSVKENNGMGRSIIYDAPVPSGEGEGPFHEYAIGLLEHLSSDPHSPIINYNLLVVLRDLFKTLSFYSYEALIQLQSTSLDYSLTANISENFNRLSVFRLLRASELKSPPFESKDSIAIGYVGLDDATHSCWRFVGLAGVATVNTPIVTRGVASSINPMWLVEHHPWHTETHGTGKHK